MDRPGLQYRLLGAMLAVPAAMGALVAGAAVLLGEAVLVPAFLVPALALAALAAGLSRTGDRRANASPDGADVPLGARLATLALGWAAVMVAGAVPFAIAAHLAPGEAIDAFARPLHALFESVSGFTSTGLSVAPSPSELPATVQLWRSLTQWVGGLGIALLMLVVMNPSRDGGDPGSPELDVGFGGGPRERAARAWLVYLGLTAATGVALALAGAPPWRALNHALTAISTGGFTVTDDSLGSLPGAERAVVAAANLASAVSLGLWVALLGRARPPAVLGALGVFLALIAGGAVALAVEEVRAGGTVDLPTALFQAVSATTTSGFSTASLGEWRPSALAVLIVCMVVGGCSGSTAGGVKADRVALLLLGLRWRLARLFDRAGPDAPVGGDRTMREARLEVESAATLIALWGFTLLGGTCALALLLGDAHGIVAIGFEAASAMSGVGLSAGIVSASMPGGAEAVLVLLMWAGRLELVAALALAALALGAARR